MSQTDLNIVLTNSYLNFTNTGTSGIYIDNSDINNLNIVDLNLAFGAGSLENPGTPGSFVVLSDDTDINTINFLSPISMLFTRGSLVYFNSIADDEISFEFYNADVPKYNSGWNVFVFKNSIIENKYDYLFYEVALKKYGLPKERWIVKKGNLETWFNKNLSLLGFNKKEQSQFMEYWLNRLDNKVSYEVGLFSDEFLNNNMALIIDPKPDVVIRRIFYFVPASGDYFDTPNVESQNRAGFAAFEWGGMLGK